MPKHPFLQCATIFGTAALPYLIYRMMYDPSNFLAILPVLDFLKDVAHLLFLLCSISILEGLDHFKIVLAVVLAAAGAWYGYRLRNGAGKKRGRARGDDWREDWGYGDERYEYEGDEDYEYEYEEEGDYEHDYDEEMEYEVEEDEAWDYDSEEDEDYDPEGYEGYEFDAMDGFHLRPGFLNNWD